MLQGLLRRHGIPGGGPDNGLLQFPRELYEARREDGENPVANVNASRQPGSAGGLCRQCHLGQQPRDRPVPQRRLHRDRQPVLVATGRGGVREGAAEQNGSRHPRPVHPEGRSLRVGRSRRPGHGSHRVGKPLG